jgi:hypothetical protein
MEGTYGSVKYMMKITSDQNNQNMKKLYEMNVLHLINYEKKKVDFTAFGLRVSSSFIPVNCYFLFCYFCSNESSSSKLIKFYSNF